MGLLTLWKSARERLNGRYVPAVLVSLLLMLIAGIVSAINQWVLLTERVPAAMFMPIVDSVAQVLIGAWVLASVIIIIRAARTLTIGDALREGTNPLWSLVGMQLLLAIGFVVLLFLPGAVLVVALAFGNVALMVIAAVLVAIAVLCALILGVYFSLASFEIIARGAGIIESLKRSFALIRDHWWASLGYYLASGIVIMLAPLILLVIASAIAAALLTPLTGELALEVAFPIISNLVFALVLPLLFAFSHEWYVHLSGEAPRESARPAPPAGPARKRAQKSAKKAAKSPAQ